MLSRRTFLRGVPGALAEQSGPGAGNTMIWYSKPAARWLDAVPIGNGRLGAMVFGGTARERIALNESTVWSGAASDEHENPGALPHLAGIRKLFFEGRYIEARELSKEHMLGREGSYGTHLPMADLLVECDMPAGPAAHYRRWLDLDEGIARLEFSTEGARFEREYLASNPDGVIAIRFTASKPGQIGLRVTLDGGSLPSQVSVAGDRTVIIRGRAFESRHSDGKSGVEFEGRAVVMNRSGRVRADGSRVIVEGADAVTLLVAAASNYRGNDAARANDGALSAAGAKSWGELRDRHIADHRRLYRRVSIDLGSAPALPTDERLAAVRAGKPDPALSALFFQYGRYLLIAGSRKDSPLPLNLQGIWNDNLACNMGWTCDFHLDINTQQNYWHAESANLGECNEPLFRLIESIREAGRRTAKKTYGADGWVCHVFTNAWGFTAPGWGLSWGLHPTGGVWIASHLWEHWRYTGDREFLANRAYPVLKEAARFFLEYMATEPKHGWLVTGPAVSPENSFLTPDGKPCSESMGPTCDSVLLRDLFGSCIEASRTLGVDAEFRARVEAARAKLPPLRVGRHGQLQEWLEDFEDAIPNHRHTTHLIALCPSNQITPRSTPELAKAARVTIARRTGQKNWEDVEWSRANLVNFFARLGDGDAAHHHLHGLLAEDTDNNLMTFSRAGVAGAQDNIFAIDGNTAGAAGVLEMLLQSHAGEIELLPALPRQWASGSVRGVRARGGFEVSLEWAHGRLAEASVQSVTGLACVVRYGTMTRALRLRQGQVVRLGADLG